MQIITSTINCVWAMLNKLNYKLIIKLSIFLILTPNCIYNIIILPIKDSSLHARI